MRYREAGALRLSEIGFGCGGNAGLMVRGAPAERQRVIARALELGINYFDNAPDYGDGTAERNLGADLKALGARPLVTSKVEVRHENLGDIAGHVVRSVDESLERLGLECLDVLQIHNGPSATAVLEGRSYTRLGMDHYAEALEGLVRVRGAGKARHLGFIVRGNDDEEVRRLIDTGAFHLINVPCNLINRACEGVIEYARAHGVGVAVYSPLAGGVLTDHAVAGGASHPLARARDPGSEAQRRAKEFAHLGRDGAHTLAQAAFRFVLAHPGVTTALGGFSDIGQLEEIAAAAST